MNKDRLHIWKVTSNQLSLLPQPQVDLQLACGYDLPNQRVIRNDAERTRNTLLLTCEKHNLELILTYYCKTTQTTYKQGLNEVLAPFIILGRSGLNLPEIYLYFRNFIRNYMPSTFVDKDFKTLQAQMSLLNLLLRYFDPQLSMFLQQLSIGPELYASPWFLTMFANKISDVDIVLRLWEEYMAENDPIFSLFIGLALIQANRSKILKTEPSFVAQMLTQLTISNPHKLRKVLDRARSFKRSLPYSIYIFMSKLPLNTLEDTCLSQIETTLSLKSLPREIIMRCYPSLYVCVCTNSRCMWCIKSQNAVPLAVVDCRAQEEQRGGVLPNTLLSVQEARISAIKGEFHIALLGDDTGAIYEQLRELCVPFVSVVEGGYKECHDLVLGFGLELEGHDLNICNLCPSDQDKGFSRTINGLRQSLLWKVRQAVSYAEDTLNGRDKSRSYGYKCRVFSCRRLDRSTSRILKTVFDLVISESQLALYATDGSLIKKSAIKDLLKITSKRKSATTLTFYFKEGRKEAKYSYIMESTSDARACIGLVSRHFNSIVPQSYASSEIIKL